MKRRTYQRGSVVLKERASLPDQWVLRYMEGDKRRSLILGDVKAFPSKALAEQEADKYRSNIASLSRTMNVSDAIDRYIEETSQVRPHTIATKKSNLWHVRQKWGEVSATGLVRDLMEVEIWLNDLQKRAGGPMSKRSKLHIKAEMHTLFESIMRWGGMEIQRNPISLLRVKGSPKKTRQSNIITIDQYLQLRSNTQSHVSMMVMIAMSLGLRVSEILGLRWEDIDISKSIMNISRSSVGKHATDDTKTEASADELPLHPLVIEELKAWKKESPSINGWVFESPKTKRPYHSGIMQRRHLHPAGKAIEPPIARLGWHDFRHTYRSMMRELELPIEVQQRLMRHADIRTTSRYGGRKMNLRGHNAAVVEMITERKKA